MYTAKVVHLKHVEWMLLEVITQLTLAINPTKKMEMKLQDEVMPDHHSPSNSCLSALKSFKTNWDMDKAKSEALEWYNQKEDAIL